jgi:hypothetical protein
MQIGDTALHQPTVLALPMRQVGIVDVSFNGGTPQFVVNGAGCTAKALGNGPDTLLIVAHGHDDCPFLYRQVRISCWPGTTLQQRVLHFVFENAQCCAW